MFRQIGHRYRVKFSKRTRRRTAAVFITAVLREVVQRIALNKFHTLYALFRVHRQEPGYGDVTVINGKPTGGEHR